MTDSARPIHLATATGNGIGHAVRSGFASGTEQSALVISISKRGLVPLVDKFLPPKTYIKCQVYA